MKQNKIGLKHLSTLIDVPQKIWQPNKTAFFMYPNSYMLEIGKS